MRIWIPLPITALIGLGTGLLSYGQFAYDSRLPPHELKNLASFSAAGLGIVVAGGVLLILYVVRWIVQTCRGGKLRQPDA